MIPEIRTGCKVKFFCHAILTIWAIKIFQDGSGPSGSSAVRSAGPENPILAPNTEWMGRPIAEIWPFEIFQHGGRQAKLETCSRDPDHAHFGDCPKSILFGVLRGSYVPNLVQIGPRLSSQCWP